MKVLEMIEILKEFNQEDEVLIDFADVESSSHTIMCDDGNIFIDDFSMNILRVEKTCGNGDKAITIIPDRVIRC